MYFLYNVLVILIVVFAIPIFIVRSIREPGFAERLRQSFGFLPEEVLRPVANRGCIWLHAASVGEIVATSPIVKEIKREMPERPILISVVTASGYIMAKRIITEADSIIFFPLDLPWLSSGVVGKIRPSVFMPVETELWPNFLRAARKHGIRVMMVNGRISDKSVTRYRYLRGLLANMLSAVTKFCMQSTIDAEYIIRLGADPWRVVVTGNTKFDQNYTDVDQTMKETLYRQMGIEGVFPVIVAGSTHKGEEESLFTAFNQLLTKFPRAKLVLAPREPLRTEEIMGLAAQYGLESARRTELLQRPSVGHAVILVDTIGELGKIYSVGDIIFVGGSLIKHGGHNILEPAAHGKPILVGPNMFNFKDSYALFTNREACMTVHDTADLAEKLIFLMEHDEIRKNMADATTAIISENRGASRESVMHLKELLAQPALCREKGKKAEHPMRQREAIQVFLYQLIHGERPGFIADILLWLLRLGSFIYGMGVSLKLGLYRVGILTQHKLPCKVISLGNITVGGTGKTPTAQQLASTIRDMGYRVVILNRGYRAGSREAVGLVSDGRRIFMTVTEAGDEAYLLAKNVPGVPVVIGKNRYITGSYAVDRLKADVVILDDGYQHWQLARDLDIVLIDTINVFGNNFLLPRGTLREPLNNLARAHAFLLTRADQSTDDARDAIRSTIDCYNDSALVVESIHSPRCFIEIQEWYKGAEHNNFELSFIQGKSVLALSAIGNPSSFEQSIINIGAREVEAMRFPDHHDYTMAEMQEVMQMAIDKGADCLVTTEKDAVKIPAEFIHSNRPLQVYVLNMEVCFTDGYEELMKLINDVMSDKRKTISEKR